jgi:hypothetical protein
MVSRFTFAASHTVDCGAEECSLDIQDTAIFGQKVKLVFQEMTE